MMRTQSACASQCISLYITSCRSYPPTTHLSFQLSSFGFFPLCSPLICLLFHSVAFLIRTLCCHHSSLVCFCQRDTCCCILLLHRIAEISCLLNLFKTLIYFIPALFRHIFTQPRCTSHRSRSFPSSRVSVSLPTRHVCTHALNFKNDKSHSPFNCFSISRHLHTPHQSTTTLTLSLPFPTVSFPLQSHSLL